MHNKYIIQDTMENQDTTREEPKQEKGNWKAQLKNEFKKGFRKEFDKEVEKEAEEHIEGNEEKPKKKKKKKSPAARRVMYIFGLFFALLFLWIINNIDNWGWEFITEDWDQIVRIVKFSIYLSIVIYIAFILHDKKLFYYVGKLAMDIVSIWVSIRMYQVFPFEFEHLFGGWGWLNEVFPWVLIIAVIGIIIGIVVRTGKFLAGKNIYD